MLLLTIARVAIASEKDSAISLIVQKGQAQLKQLEAQNRLNDSLGFSDQNQYVLNINTGDLFPQVPKVDSLDTEFIKQRKLTYDNEKPDRMGFFFIYSRETVDRLNERLRLVNNLPGTEVKTYMLLVDFVPMDFTREFPLGITLNDLLYKDSADATNTAIGKQAMKTADSIVTGITAPFLANSPKSLYCGFLRFRAFINEWKFKDLYIYYPHNNVEDTQMGGAYNTILQNYIHRISFKNGEQYVSDFIEAIAKNNADYQHLPSVRERILSTLAPAPMENLLNEVSNNAYDVLDLEERVHALKVLSSADIPDSREILINELLETTPTAQIPNLLAEMQKANDQVPAVIVNKQGLEFDNPKSGWCLLQCIIANTQDEHLFWGENNYGRLMQALIRLTRDNPDWDAQLKAYYNDPDIEKKKIIWDRSYALSLVGRPPVGTNIYDVELNPANCDITLDKQQLTRYKTITATSRMEPGNIEVSVSTEKPIWEPESAVTLHPFELVSFTNKSDLTLLSDALKDAGANEKKEQFVPAVLLKYAADKKLNQDVGKGIEMGLDVVTLIIPAGEVLYLGKVVNYIYKGIEIAAKAGSVANLAINTDIIPPNSQLAKTMKKYQAILAILQIGNAAASIRNMQLAKLSRAEATEFLEAYYRSQDEIAELASREPAAMEELEHFSRELEMAGESGGYGKGWYVTIKAAAKAKFSATVERFRSFTFLKQQRTEAGLIRFIDDANLQVAHTASDGTLIVDKTGQLLETTEGTVMDIVEGAKFRAAEGVAETTDDLMMIKKANGAVECVKGACFVAGTPVHTRRGLKPIEQVQENDTVLSVQVASGDTVYQQVERSFSKQANSLIRIVAGQDTLLSTPEHPYLTTAGWKSASLLHKDELLRLPGKGTVPVLASSRIDTTVTVYNFSVAVTHNYVIGRQGIVVHNDCRIFAKLRSKIKPELYDQFVKDFNGNATLLAKFDKGDIAIEAWEMISSYKGLRKTATSLDLATKLVRNSKLARSGLDAGTLQRLIKANNSYYGFKAASLDELLKGFDELVTSGSEFTDIGKLITDIEKGNNFAVGAQWTTKYMMTHLDDFKNQALRFEVVEKVGENIRRVDIKSGKNSLYTFWEFKSTSAIPPDGFIEQFTRDLKLFDVNSLSQLKWRFDPGKVLATVNKKNFVDLMKANKASFDNEKILNIFREFSEQRIRNVDELMTYLEKSDDWFTEIFNIKAK
jgi:hypothetical protein